MPHTDFPIERLTLDNGLRVVLSPDRSAPLVAIAVHYDVGFRSEPEGRTGFAHLFEHMMFQGSEHLGKMEHVNLVLGGGGSLNGSTTPDYTNYYEILPSTALDLGLFLEADRMRALRLTEENLANQISVVQEEIRVNVLNRPYGGFPWIWLSEVMFDSFANSHNGYGSFVDLEAATLEDVRDFFAQFYAPSNAVLTVVGDIDVDATAGLIERHFGGIAARPAPQMNGFGEPLPTTPRRARREDAHAPTPAVALGYRVPDPVGSFPEVLEASVLTAVLTSGEASRLKRRLVRKDAIATSIDGWVGVFGGGAGPFERDPTRLQLMAHYQEPRQLDRIVETIDQEVARLISDLEQPEVDRTVASITGSYLRRLDGFMSRALTISPLELLHGRAEIVNEIPERLAAITAQRIVDTAACWLEPSARTVLEIVPTYRVTFNLFLSLR